MNPPNRWVPAVLDCFSRGPTTARVVAAVLGVTPRRAQQMLTTLGERGQLRRAGKRPTKRKSAHLWTLP